jgi:uncharacterized protein YjgD (DUF1641 family)
MRRRMMSLRTITYCAMAAIIAFSLACKKSGSVGKYGEIEALMDEVVAANEEYLSAVDKASSADDVVNAIDTLTAEMTPLAGKMEELMTRYPDLKGMNMSSHPTELDAAFERQKALGQKMVEGQGKIMKYMTDPRVSQALLKSAKATMKFATMMK